MFLSSNGNTREVPVKAETAEEKSGINVDYNKYSDVEKSDRINAARQEDFETCL